MKSTIPAALGSAASLMMRRQVLAVTQVRTHGTQRPPALVRGVQAQPAEGGVQVSWSLPTRYNDVTGYRIYLGSEKNLAIQVKDRGTRQVFVPTQSGATPPTANIFVSAINGYRESHSVQVQSAPVPNANIPNPKPGPPTNFVDGFSGGLDKTQSGQPVAAVLQPSPPAPPTQISGPTTPPFNISQDGFITLAGGLIIQWGFTPGPLPAGYTVITFPEPFPNACFSVTPVGMNSSVDINAITNTTFTIGVASGNTGCAWIATGH